MVKKLFLVLWMTCMFSLEAAPVIEASIDGNSSVINSPLFGTLSITHQKNEKIDPRSFTLNGKLLEVQFIREISISDTQIISFYQFHLSGQEQGLYILPSISAKVGGEIYKTIPSTYEVKSSLTIPKKAAKKRGKRKAESNEDASMPVVFRLDALVKGPKILYPGQRTKLFYRIVFNRSIDLTRSALPFVHPEHFKRIGDVQIRDYEEGHLTMQDIVQEIEASEIGVFDLGPSFIEGYAYHIENGQKKYDSTQLRSETPAIRLEVKSFPKKNQPPSFNGALGKINVIVKHDFPASVSIGDTLHLEFQIEGISNLADLHLPSIECQPGIAGFFQTPDLPPPGDIEQEKKIFHVELRPLTHWIKKIPSIEISSFEPQNQEYTVENTKPIELTIQTASTFDKDVINESTWPSQAVPNNWPVKIPDPLDFTEPPISIQPVKQSFLSSMWVLVMFPLSLGIIFLQNRWRKRILLKKKSFYPKSEKLFREALSHSSNPLKQARLFEEAFWYKIREKGSLGQGQFNLEALPDSIRSFIYQLQLWQYGPEKNLESSKMIEIAKKLFKGL